MRRFLLCLGMCWATLVQAEGITEVLQRSQQQRLDQRAAADPGSTASARVQASFDRLVVMLPDAAPVALQLVGGALFAEARFGQRCVVASEAVGELPEGERLLLLAHELGHVVRGHWSALSGLYRQHIPGAVRPDTTEPVAALLGAQAHALSHQQEFEADAFGFTLVRQLGFGVDNAFGLLLRQGLQFDSATHPATRRRLAQLRLLDTHLAHAPLMAGGVATTLADGRQAVLSTRPAR